MDEAGEFYVDATIASCSTPARQAMTCGKMRRKIGFGCSRASRLVVLRGDDEQSPVRNVTIVTLNLATRP